MALSMFNHESYEEGETPVLVHNAANSMGAWNPSYEVMNLKENDILFREGEVPRGLYFIKSGCVKVITNRSMTRGRMSSPEFISKLVGPGEFFGYKAAVQGTNYSYQAKALRPTEVHVYPVESVKAIMNGPNTLNKMLFNQMIKDLEANENISQLHYLASVQERIAYQLVLLTDKFGVQQADGIHLNLRLTRNELAQLAGTINESLSRHLTEFKNEGIVELNGKEIILKDRQALMAKSGNFHFSV